MIVYFIEYHHDADILLRLSCGGKSPVYIPKPDDYAFFIKGNAYEVKRLEFHPETRTVKVILRGIDHDMMIKYAP